MGGFSITFDGFYPVQTALGDVAELIAAAGGQVTGLGSAVSANSGDASLRATFSDLATAWHTVLEQLAAGAAQLSTLVGSTRDAYITVDTDQHYQFGALTSRLHL